MKETTKINNHYQYEDYDVLTILNLRLQQENLNDVSVIPPLSTLEGDQLQIQLQGEQNKSHATPNRTILIPYNLGNYHWVGIVIRVENNHATEFTYYDSSLPDNEISEYYLQLFDTLSKFYKVDIKGNVASGLKQRDGTSCGPLTIENLINAALHHVINGFANVLDIRAQHVYLMDTFAPEHYFDVRQFHNLPSFQFDQQYNQIQKNLSSNHNQAVDDETILANIAENYKQRNTIPQLNKQELLAYLLKAIEKTQSAYALQQSAEVLKYLTALSALSKALQENYSKFVEENTGIPWDELSNLVRDINLHYEPSHGIAGHVILPNKRAYLALDFRKELIVEIIKDLEELQLSFKALAEFEYLEQKIPIANRIKTISNYLAEEVELELLQKGAMVCSGLKLNTSEDRVFYLRQLALIGEAFVQLPGYLLKHFNINFVNFCKIIRNAIDHFETEFIQSNPGDKELKAIVFWLKNFIETGNLNNPPARLAKSAILDLINNPGEIEHYIIPILQTILTAQEPLSNFTPFLLEKPADLSYSFIDDEEEQNFLPYPMASVSDQELHDYMLGIINSPDDEFEVEPWREELKKIESNYQYYLVKFLAQVSLQSDLYTQIQFLKFVQSNIGSLSQELIQKAQAIEKKLLLIKHKPAKTHPKNGKVVREAEDIAEGTLNKVAQKGGDEDFSNLDAVLYYLHLFQESFYSLKLATSLTESEQQLLVQYESVQASYLTKIQQVIQASHLSNKTKQTYLDNFLQFFLNKFRLIDTQFQELFHNQSEEPLDDQDLEFYFLYNRIAANHQNLMKQQLPSFNTGKKSEIESAISLISEIIAVNDKVQEYFAKIADLSVGINSIDEHSLEVLNRYKAGIDLLTSIGGDKFILPANQKNVVVIKDRHVKAFTKFLQQLPQEVRAAFEKRVSELKSADLNIKVILMQQEMLSYGLEIHNPISLPEDCDIATFHPVRSVQYYSGLVDREEQAIISQLSKLYHANREFYQILIGSYARALLDNEVFMAYASDKLYTTLHHLRAGRGYLGHNTEPNLGKGEDIETHSSNIAYTLIKELLSIIPELLILQLILTDDDIKFVDGVRNLHSQYHSKMAGNSVEALLQKILSRTIDIAPKESLASHDWLTGDQIAGIGDTMNTAIPFIPSVDGHLNPAAHGAIEPMIQDNLTNTITAAINVSPNVDVNSGKGNHWIFYFATQGTDGVMHGVLLNPMGNHLYDLTMQSIQARMIAAYGGPNRAQIKIHNLGMQTDSYNCGVWVLWFLEQINQLQQQGITIDEIFVHNLPDILKGLNIADINAKRAEYKAMLDASNESQHTASCSEEGRSTNKDKKDDEDEDDGFSRPHSTKDNVGQNSLTIQTTSLTEASKTSSTNSGNTSSTTNTKTAAIILETSTFDEKLSNQLNYYLEHAVMFDSLRQTINQNDIIPEQHLAYISNTYISYAVGMLIFCSLSTVSDYSSIHKSEGYDGHFNVLPCLLGMAYDSIIPNIY